MNHLDNYEYSPVKAEYYNPSTLLKVSFLTHRDDDDPTLQSNKWAGPDGPKEFEKNCKKMPKDWHYRNKVVEYHVNSFGYRAPEFDTVYWEESIVLFGCSMTAGIGVAEDETISHFLQEKSERPVINLGWPGCGLDFMMYNNYLLKHNYPKPWGVVNLFTSPDRMTFFKQAYMDQLGLWTANDNYWKGFMRKPTNYRLISTFQINIMREMWKDTRYFDATWFDTTGCLVDNCQSLHFTNTARDLIHCGRIDNKRNAALIWSYLNNY